MAREFQTVIKLGMDSTKFTGSVTEINRKMRVLDAEFKNASEQAKAFGQSADALKVKQEALTQKIELQAAKVAKLKERYEKSIAEKGKDAAETDRLAVQYNKAEQALTKMQGELDKTTKELEKHSKGTDDASKKLKEFSERAKKTGEEMSKVGENILKVTAPIMGLGIATGKMAMDFEEAMAKVDTIADTTVVSMEDLSNGVINLSDKYGMASKDIANALYESISAGVETTKSLDFLDAALKNSVAGFTDAVTSVNTLTNVMNAYDIEIERSLEISDKLIKVQKYGKTTIGQFGDEIGRAAPLAAQAGMSVEELFANIATLTKNSIKSNEALTATKAIISNIIKPTKEAAEEAKRLGLRFDAAALESLGFEKFLERVMLKTRGNTDSLVKLFGSVNALNAVMLLTSQKGSKDFREALDEINNSAGTTDMAFDKMDKTSMKYRRTLEQIKNALIELGETLLPIFEVVFGFVQTLTKVLSILSNLSPFLMRFIFILATIGTVVGTILFTVGKFMQSFSAITTFLGTMNITMNITYLKVMLVVAALVALAAIIAVIMGRTGDIERTAKAIGNISAPTIPQAGTNQRVQYHARGTAYHPGGLALVGEEGPELLNLPRGSQVHSHTETKGILGQSAGDTFVFNVHMDEIDDLIKFAKAQKDLRRNTRMGLEMG